MKITLRFSAGQIATLERGVWQCADKTLLAICKMPPRRRPSEIAPHTLIRSVMLLAGRFRASVNIEIEPGGANENAASLPATENP